MLTAIWLRIIDHTILPGVKAAVMLSSVEAWWVGLCARPFDKLRVTGLGIICSFIIPSETLSSNQKWVYIKYHYLVIFLS